MYIEALEKNDIGLIASYVMNIALFGINSVILKITI